jgi:hypothetical protein
LSLAVPRRCVAVAINRSARRPRVTGAATIFRRRHAREAGDGVLGLSPGRFPYAPPGSGFRRVVNSYIHKYHYARWDVERAECRIQHVTQFLAQLQQEKRKNEPLDTRIGFILLGEHRKIQMSRPRRRAEINGGIDSVWTNRRVHGIVLGFSVGGREGRVVVYSFFRWISDGIYIRVCASGEGDAKWRFRVVITNINVYFERGFSKFRLHAWKAESCRCGNEMRLFYGVPKQIGQSQI